WLKDRNEFRAYLDKYQEHTYQIFRQRTSTSVEKRNAEITATNNRRVRGQSPTRDELTARGASSSRIAGSESDAQRLITLELKTFWTKLGCTHDWNTKSRGKGIRKCHFDRGTGCKANIKAAVAWNDAEGVFMVRVTDYDVRHNHAVSKATYQNHVSNRQVQDSTLLAFVDELQAAGAKPKLMMQYLRKKTGKNVTLRDVHNLVFVDEAKPAQTITMQTRQMCRWFKIFPEALMIDATHNTNESRYKLFSFMVNDVYGHVRDDT
ncbi:ABC transporter, partial [Phytophthora megakarya]